jgi:dihydroorotase
MHDLVLKGGRVIDPAQNIDRVTDIAFADGKIAALGDNLAGKDTRDVKGKIVTPGLIDYHTHIFWGGTSIGLHPTPYAHQAACTTLVDAGTAGPANFHGFRRFIIEQTPVRVVAYINLSFPGIYAFSPAVMVGESQDIRLLDVREVVRIANQHRDVIVGIKVRVGRGTSADSGVHPIQMAIEAAELLGMPIMAHLDFPPPSRKDVLSLMRKGDVLTHCFRPAPNAPNKPDGGVRDEVIAARQRGIIFDIGHGAGSFGYATTKAMLAAGFLPDMISSDMHVLSINGPAYDQLITMSKFLCLGLDLMTVVRASSTTPARVLGKPELGTLEVGTPGDVSVFEQVSGDFTYVDVIGEKMKGDKQLRPHGIVVAGRWLKDDGVRFPDPHIPIRF